MAQMKLTTKQKLTHTHREQTCGCQWGGGGSGKDWEFLVSRCKLLHLEWISNEVLLCSTGNCQISWDVCACVCEKERERETRLLCCTAESGTAL